MIYKYQEVVDLMKQRIISGEYKPGDKLPSIKQLSIDIKRNTDTIIKAYKLLEAEHMIYSVPKSGFYVVKSHSDPINISSVIDMRTVGTPDSISPYKDYYHCMEKAIELYGNRLFEYSNPKGMPELIKAVEKHLMGFHIFARSDEIFITTGAQQALYILGNMDFPNGGTKILVEQPTYSVMLQMLLNNGKRVIGIRRTKEGIDIKELEDIFRQGDIKFFFTMPRFQNPTGFSYNYVQKKKITELAAKYGVYIVEDDYLADLEPDKKADSLYVLGEKEYIIYVRSFSKTLLPGLRLGMCILPGKLREAFLLQKHSMDLNTPIITQGALEIYIKSKMYSAHIHRTKEYYRRNMDMLRQELEGINESRIAFNIPSTGLYAYAELNGISSDYMEKKLINKGILIRTTKECYLECFPSSEGLRFSVCNLDETSIKKFADIIKKEIR